MPQNMEHAGRRVYPCARQVNHLMNLNYAGVVCGRHDKAQASVLLTRLMALSFKIYQCRGGEIGRHDGLKIHWGKTRAGSSPALGTIH